MTPVKTGKEEGKRVKQMQRKRVKGLKTERRMLWGKSVQQTGIRIGP